MIRVLIAEDELPLLRGIKRLIESIDPDFTVVCCASNGREALDYLTQHTVELVFTDINMPLLDGLELLSELSGRGEEFYTVVISGYDSFQYAQKAMRLGTRSYLLKPIDKQELTGLLKQFKSERNLRSHTHKREKLLRLLFGGISEKSDGGWGNLSLYYLCAGSFQRHPYTEELPEAVFWEDGAVYSYLKERLKLLDRGEAWLFWGQNSNEALIVLEDAPEFSYGEFMGFLTEQMKNKTFLTLAVGPDSCDPGKLMSLMHQLRIHISRQAVFGEHTIIPWDDVSREEKPLPDIFHQQISAYTTRYQADNLLLVLEQMKDYVKHHPVTQYRLEKELGKILLMIQGKSGDSWLEVQQTVQDIVAATADYDTLFEALKVVCRDSLEGEPFDTTNKEVLMKSVDVYIRKNISKPFTTNELARQFGLVAPYLSKLFKCYKGMSPTQYMQSMRMERAQQILADCPDLLVKDIAEQLGYANALYFSKVFKKTMGMYPSEYRSLHLEGKTMDRSVKKYE